MVFGGLELEDQAIDHEVLEVAAGLRGRAGTCWGVTFCTTWTAGNCCCLQSGRSLEILPQGCSSGFPTLPPPSLTGEEPDLVDLIKHLLLWKSLAYIK